MKLKLNSNLNELSERTPYSDFLVPTSLQPNVVYLRYFKLLTNC